METKAEVLEKGPLLVHATISITHKNGNIETKKRTTAFCRCGASNTKPYCDGNHNTSGFND